MTTMKIEPLMTYKTPRYPTIEEIGEMDLSRVPVRWSRLKGAVASLGMVALALKAAAQEVPPPAPITAVAGAEAQAEEPAQAEKKEAAATTIVPLLSVALAGEGRGGFGCVAINPPVMLPETEALEIIEKEFAAQGIVLKDCPELDGVELPSRPGKKRLAMLDFGTEKGDLMIEYVSRDDIETWKEPEKERIYSSFSTFDIRAAAERAVKALSERKTGKPVTVGVLYDPVVHVPKDWVEKNRDTTDWKTYYEAKEQEGRRLAREKLIRQIENVLKCI